MKLKHTVSIHDEEMKEEATQEFVVWKLAKRKDFNTMELHMWYVLGRFNEDMTIINAQMNETYWLFDFVATNRKNVSEAFEILQAQDSRFEKR